MSTLSDTTTAVALALLVTVTFSGAFFYMMRWAAASSERQRSRYRRVIAGDGFTATKHKKTVAAAVVHQRKKNVKNAGFRPASAAASSTVSANDRNGDNNKKKKPVDNSSILTNDDIAATAAYVGNRRTRRQKYQEQVVNQSRNQSHTPADSSTDNHLLSSVDDIPVHKGEWITMSSGNNSSFVTVDSSGESNRRKVIENKIERCQPQVEKHKRERRSQQIIKPDKTAVGIIKAAPVISEKITTIVTSPFLSQDKPVVAREYDTTSQHDVAIEKHLRVKVENLQAELKSLRAEHEITIKTLRADSENTRAKHSAVTERLHAAEREITTLKQTRSDQETALKTLHLKFMNLTEVAVQDAHSNQKSIIEEIKAKHESAVLGLRKENEVLMENHETAIRDLREVTFNLSKKYELEIKHLRADHESTIRQIRKENSDLHTEHANAIKVLQDEHESVIASETRRLTEYHTAVVQRLLNQHRTEIKQLKQQLIIELHQQVDQTTTRTKLQQTSNFYQNNDTVTVTSSDVENNFDLEMRNRKLHRTVLHYKQIIADTEQMLSQLHEHVEREEFHWSKHAADLQKQLDETRRQLEDPSTPTK